jgi:arylsulfatase A-like enzyme
LFKIANQNFLLHDEPVIDPKYAELIYQRQQTSYQIIKDDLNLFVERIHKDKNNLVVFCSDHGDNFGEMNWYYHFSNVNDGGNRVPLFWLNPNGDGAQKIDTPVSSRFIFHSLMEAIGIEQNATLFKNETLNFPTIQSFWYKHQQGTREKYKYNQFLFVEGKKRFVKRNAAWMYAPLTDDNYHQEPAFELLNNTNPISEFVEDKEKKEYLLNKEKEFDAFSSAMKMA